MRLGAKFVWPIVLGTLLLGGCVTRTPEDDVPIAAFNWHLVDGAPRWTILFDASPSCGNIIRYYWAFGDGADGVGQEVTHRYDAPGKYHVVLTVVDEDGDAAWADAWVDVMGIPPVPVIEAPAEAPSWQTITFDATGSYDPDGLIVSYRWDFGDGTVAEGPVVYHLFPFLGCHGEPKTYIVTLTVEDDDGLTATAQHRITLYPTCVSEP